MDTVIGNKYIDIFNNLDIEVSKKLEGEYDVDEIIETFGKFFFNKMFLDITSIKNYKDMDNLKKLSMNLDMDKVILLLDKDDAISGSDVFLAKLVSMGIYNFTTDSNALMYLYKNPNIYRDVAHYQDIYNDNAAASNENVNLSIRPNKKKIIGIKNVTDGAGSTTFCYLLMKVLSDYYNVIVVGVDSVDLTFFNDNNCFSIKGNELESIINRNDDVEIIIIDLNDSRKENLCNDVLYLIEPSTIKLNKLVTINPGIFDNIRYGKIIINKLLLSNKDITNFEVESNLKVYYNVGTVNDKEDNSSIFLPLLSKLGYVDEQVNTDESTSKKSIFDIFKK